MDESRMPASLEARLAVVSAALDQAVRELHTVIDEIKRGGDNDGGPREPDGPAAEPA